MVTIIYILGTGAFLFLVYFLTKSYLTWRGQRLVTCPELKTPTAVEINAKHAAFTTILGRQDLVLKSCTHWPEKQGCGQMCLQQIEDSPESCLVRHVLTEWYADKICIYCAKPFRDIHWHDHKPVFRSPDGDFLEWSELHIEKLEEILRTHDAVCWNCFIAENFRKLHPDLVTDRPRRGGYMA